MKLKIKNLLQHELITNIRHVNPMFVSRYRQAMRNGDQFPPVLVDQDNYIISGNHRFQAYWEEFGEEHTIEVIRKRYSNDQDRIKDAIAENAKHGNPLDGISRKRAVAHLTRLGADPKEVAVLLGVSVKRIEQMAGETVIVIGGKGRPSQAEPIKRGLSHIRGTKVSQSKYEQHEEHDRGISAGFMAGQLLRWVKNGWIDMDNEKTVAALAELKEALNEIV